MFPNPQDALPVPALPNLEHYKKLAKISPKPPTPLTNLRCMTGLRIWIESLVKLTNLTITPRLPVRIDRWIDEIEAFTRSQKMPGGKLALTRSQFILARSHGFESWPKFAKHLHALARANTPVSNFERAAEAIVAGRSQHPRISPAQNSGVDSRAVDPRASRNFRRTTLPRTALKDTARKSAERRRNREAGFCRGRSRGRCHRRRLRRRRDHSDARRDQHPSGTSRRAGSFARSSARAWRIAQSKRRSWRQHDCRLSRQRTSARRNVSR